MFSRKGRMDSKHGRANFTRLIGPTVADFAALSHFSYPSFKVQVVGSIPIWVLSLLSQFTPCFPTFPPSLETCTGGSLYVCGIGSVDGWMAGWMEGYSVFAELYRQEYRF